jgi:hypothetical protein
MLSPNKLKYQDMLFLLQQAPRLVPGLQKALCFYYDAFDKAVNSSIIEAHKNQILEVNPEEEFDLGSVMQLRKEKHRYSWITEEELPFNVQRENSIQRKVFDEYENVVLRLSFPNKDDKKRDLIYLYINIDATNFGLRKSGDLLNTENKAIIGQLIYNSFDLVLQQRAELLAQEQRLKEHLQLLQRKYEELQQEKNRQKSDTAKQLLSFCNGIINKYAQELGIHIEMSRELMELISNYRGSIPLLEQNLVDAIQRAYDTNSDMYSPVLRMEAWHFNDLEQVLYNDGASATEPMPDSRYLNTYNLLNRMENAARKLLSNHEKMTGANLGKAMDTPITAAAISDAMKKHKAKINSLCKQYPNHWQLVRNEFRPLMNILNAG